jgi:tetratricopeptide (TPR) repeat protein
VRDADLAFAHGDYAGAEVAYAVIMERSVDPGRFAFNRGVCQYHMGQYRAAELLFRQALDNAEPQRRAPAWYNLGLCLLQQTGPAAAERANAARQAFAHCRDLCPADAPLRADACHNLELAALLALQAATAESPLPPGGDEPKSDPAPPEPAPVPMTAPGPPMTTPMPDPHGRVQPPMPGDPPPQTTDAPPAAGAGKLPPLTDAGTPINPADAAEHLRRAVQRIEQETQAARTAPRKPAPASVPDW